MDYVQMLQDELDRELSATRAIIEAVPGDRLDWQPHPKSMTLNRLACHTVEVIGWAHEMINMDQFNMKPSEYKALSVSNSAELLSQFESKAKVAREAMASITQEQLDGTWEMQADGKTFIKDQRASVLRTWLFSHLVHHRAQLTVYLRLLEVPVPMVYGPTADVQPPAM